VLKRAVVVAAAILLSACSGGGSGANSTGYVSGDGSITVVPPAERKPAPTLAGVDLHGEPLTAGELGGTFLVVNVWGSWCAPCRREAPVLAEAARRYEDRGVRFLGLLSRDKPAAALAFNRTFKVPYPSLQDPGGRLQLRFSDSLPGQAVPNTWVIDSRGRVAARIMAEISESTLRTVLDEVGVPAQARKSAS
jgi:thiol-disulfide isomerase/thioredoxin